MTQPHCLDLPAQVENRSDAMVKTQAVIENRDGLKLKVNKDYRILIWALLLGLIQGVLYIYLVPPWQHYDEPSHFEFAWLSANSGTPTDKNTYNLSMRRELVASMIEHDFFNEVDIRPNLISQEEEIWIGISQVNPRSFYYFLAGAPLRLIRTSDITFQMYGVRAVSLFLFLLTILSAWGIAREITEIDHPLRWMLPFSLVLVPGFVEIMSAVNDDVGAVAIFSLFLWSGVRIIKRGINWRRLLGLTLLALACFWVKNTVTIAVLLYVLPIAFSFSRQSLRRIALYALGAGFVVAVLSIVKWGDAAYWIRLSFPDLAARQTTDSAPLGEGVIQIPVTSDHSTPRLVQVIPGPIVQKLRGEKITVGSLIWSDKPGKVRSPQLVTENGVFSKEVEVGEEPTFFSYTADIDPENSRLSVVLSPKLSSDQDFQVFYDGIILVEGKRPKKSPPIFDDPNGLKGQWGQQAFTNILRNGSAEKSWPWIKTWAERFFSENFPGRLSLIFAFTIDHGSSLIYYKAALEKLFQSFWAGFGWGNIPLLGAHTFLFLSFFTLLSVLGAVVRLIRNWKQLPWAVIVFLGIAVLFICGSALMRGSSSIIDGRYIFPVARYLYPVIIPLMMILNAGWLEGSYWLDKIVIIPSIYKKALFGLFFLFLNVLGIVTIVQFYS